MVFRMSIHLNIELQIPVIYRADFGLRGFTPLISIYSVVCNEGVRENNCSVTYAYVIFRIVSDHGISWLVE